MSDENDRVKAFTDFRQRMNLLEDSGAQVAAVEEYLDQLNEKMDRIPRREHASSLARGHDMMELAA